MLEIEQRDVGIENIDTLYWNKRDVGAFGIKDKDGPIFDWQLSVEGIIGACKDFDVVIQAGGCMGMYPRFYCNYFKQIYTFEPNPDNFEILSMNLTNQIEARQCALGIGVEGSVGVSLRGTQNGDYMNFGACSILDEKNRNILEGDIPVISIDSLNVDKCDLIHLDVEQYEPYVIEGAMETINKFKPVIVLESSVDIPGYSVGRQLRNNLLYLPLT
jgi:FkbM family methyltransferase